MAGNIWPVDAVTGAPSYAGRALRQTTVSPFVAMGAGTRPLGGVSGVRPGTPNTIVTATSTTWTVTPFAGVIDGAAAAIAGAYAYAFSTNQTGSVTAAGASARTDRLDVQVIDPAEGGVGGANPLIQIVYTVGAPGLAAAPAQSHPLAQINVPISGGGSPTVTWTAAYCGAAGGYVPFNTLATLQAWTTATVGQHASVINDPVPSNNSDYLWNGTSWGGASGASQMVVPASISGTGATVSALGKITLSACSSVALNGVFTSGFDNYRLVANITHSSAAIVQYQMRVAGANATGSFYSYMGLQGSGSSAGAGGVTSTTSAFLTNQSGLQADVDAMINAPALVTNTRIMSTFYAVTGGTQSVGVIASTQSQPVSFDGITISPSTGGVTMTGTIRIYGWNNG